MSEPRTTAPSLDFDTLVAARHSTRRFLPDAVPRELITDSLALAQLAPSNSNTQPWRLHIATGAARERLCRALVTAATPPPAQAAAGSADEAPAKPTTTTYHTPLIAPLPAHLTHFRSELGRDIYGPNGLAIARDDPEAHVTAMLRNYDFFGAPVVGVVSMDPELERWDAMSVGMWLQTFVLALTERNLATCLEVSVVGYPEVLRRESGMDDNGDVLLCGIGIGWEDESQRVNKIHTGRQGWERAVVWAEE